MEKRIAAAVFVLLAARTAMAAAASPPAVAPALIDQTGHRFAFTALRGTRLIVTFVAAHCTDACPLVDAQFARASEEFARNNAPVKLLTITLDPEHDSPAVMRDLARRFNADPKHWIVASGTVRDVHRIMSAFGVAAQQGPHGYAEMHSTFVYFVDKKGMLRKTLLASTALATQITELAQR